MVDIAELGLKIDSKDIIKAIKRLDKLEKQSKENVNQNSKLKSSFKGLGTALGSLGLGLAFKSIITLAIEQERVIKQVDAAIKSTGGSAGFTTKELQTMAAGFQDVTTFGDEAILSMQSVLLTFTNLKGDVLPATTEAVLNLSARMGIDLQSSAVQLGKALNDPIANLSALSRSGIQFSDSQKSVIKEMVKTNRLADAQALILKELEVQFGGSAKAARDTFGGSLKSLGNAFGDLLEGDGGNLNDAKGAIEELTQVLQDEGTREAFGAIVTLIVGITAALATMISKLSSGGKHLGEFLANALAEETTSDRLDDIKERMEDLANVMRKTATAPEGTLMAERFKEARDELAKLVEQFIALGGAAGAPTIRDADDTKKKKIEQVTDHEDMLDKLFEADIEYFDKQSRIIEMEDERDAIKREKAEAELEYYNNYYERLYNLQTGSLQAAADFAEAIRDGDTKSALRNGSLMLSNMAKSNKQAFEVQKSLALANAIVTLPSAVMKSYDNGGGYPWGLIPAGLMLAAGLNQISSIQSTTFGSKSSSASVGGGGGTSPSAPVGSGLPPGSTATPDGTEQIRREVTITLNGAGYSRDDVRELIEKINEEQEDGSVLVVV